MPSVLEILSSHSRSSPPPCNEGGEGKQTASYRRSCRPHEQELCKLRFCS